MGDDLFPSGPWVGFYKYSRSNDKHRMDLDLSFANGNMTGTGTDDVSRFLIKGRYDAANKECYWTKSYLGAHDVFYRGFREGKGIWGVWELALGRGGFHIWPRGFGEGDGETVSAEQQKPKEAIADQKPALEPVRG